MLEHLIMTVAVAPLAFSSVVAAPAFAATEPSYVCDTTVKQSKVRYGLSGTRTFPPYRSFDSDRVQWVPAGRTLTVVPDTRSPHPEYPDLMIVQLTSGRWAPLIYLTSMRNCRYED